MDGLEQVRRYVGEHAEQMFADLQRLVRQPSVSATGHGAAECARLLVEMMAGLGIEAEAAALRPTRQRRLRCPHPVPLAHRQRE